MVETLTHISADLSATYLEISMFYTYHQSYNLYLDAPIVPKFTKIDRNYHFLYKKER